MLDLKITGDSAIAETIAKASMKMIKTAGFEALAVALQPLVARLKANAPGGATGDLRKAITFRIKRKAGGRRLLGSAGTRDEKGDQRRSNYVWLVEFGHWAGKGKGRVWVPASGFMRRSWLEQRDRVLNTFNREFGTRLFAAVETPR